jgi:predicted dehydrogenase
VTDSEVTIAALGLGNRMAAVIGNLCRAEPRVRMLGYCDPSPLGLSLMEAAEVPAGRRFDDEETMLRVLQPDWVMVGSPNHLHLSHIRLSIASGARVFSEKPVVRTPAESFALARLLRESAPECLLVGLVLRSAPLVRAVRRQLEKGALGRLVSLEANEHLHPEHGGFLARDWRRREEWAGSFLLDKCCHDFDLYRLFVGSRALRVASFAGRDVFTRENTELDERRYPAGNQPYRAYPVGWRDNAEVFGADADAMDNQVAIVEYENGVRLAFHANTHSSVVQRRWLLAGTRGTLEADLVENKLLVRDLLSDEPTLRESFQGRFAGHFGADEEMARDLAAHMVEGRRFPVSAYDALVAGLSVMAIDRAARTGEVIDCSAWWSELDALYPLSPESEPERATETHSHTTPRA